MYVRKREKEKESEEKSSEGEKERRVRRKWKKLVRVGGMCGRREMKGED